VVGIALEGERHSGVPGKGLEIADDPAALHEEREAPMPKATQTPYGLLHSCCTRG
jgi:hypothetical protein